MGYFTDPNTGKRRWSGGIKNKPNPTNLVMRPLTSNPKVKPKSRSTQEPPGHAVSFKAQRKERAKRTVPSSSPVSNGAPRSSGSSGPPVSVSTPVSRPVLRRAASSSAPTPARTSKPVTPKRNPNRDVSKPAPKEPYKFQKDAKTNPAAKIYNRALSRYRARHRGVGGDVAARVVEKLVSKGHQGYVSDAGFKGKGKLRKRVTLAQLGGPDKPPSPGKGEKKTRKPDNKPRYRSN